MKTPLKILVTGAKGFIGKNLISYLRTHEWDKTKNQAEMASIDFSRGDSLEKLENDVSNADSIIHLAGVNRPDNEEEFNIVNRDLTIDLCKIIKNSGKNIPLLLASSTQATKDNPYG